MAIVGFPGYAGISGLLIPPTHVRLDVEVLLELRRRAIAGRNACFDKSNERKGSDDENFEHSFFDFHLLIY